MRYTEAVRTIVPCEVLFLQILYIGHILGGTVVDILGVIVGVSIVTILLMIKLADKKAVKKTKAKKARAKKRK